MAPGTPRTPAQVGEPGPAVGELCWRTGICEAWEEGDFPTCNLETSDASLCSRGSPGRPLGPTPHTPLSPGKMPEESLALSAKCRRVLQTSGISAIPSSNSVGLGHCRHLGVWILERNGVAVGRGETGKGREFLVWKERPGGKRQSQCMGKLAPARQGGEFAWNDWHWKARARGCRVRFSLETKQLTKGRSAPSGSRTCPWCPALGGRCRIPAFFFLTLFT